MICSLIKPEVTHLNTWHFPYLHKISFLSKFSKYCLPGRVRNAVDLHVVNPLGLLEHGTSHQGVTVHAGEATLSRALSKHSRSK